MRVDMHAIIMTFDNTMLSKLKSNYDRKSNILGCEKLHIRANYDMVLSVINERTFDSLWEEYNYHVDIFKAKYPSLQFDTI